MGHMGHTETPAETIENLAAETLYDFALDLPDDRFEDGGGTPEPALVKVTSPELGALLEQAITAGVTAELRTLAADLDLAGQWEAAAALNARADVLAGGAR